MADRRVENAAGGANVSRDPDNGLLVIWAGEESDPIGIVTSPAGALITAQRLWAAVAPNGAPTIFGGEIEQIDVLPPVDGAPGRLFLTIGGVRHGLVMNWPVMVQLSEIVTAALRA